MAGSAPLFGHKTTKLSDLTATVNDAIAQGKLMFLFGEICKTCDRKTTRSDDWLKILLHPSQGAINLISPDSVHGHGHGHGHVRNYAVDYLVLYAFDFNFCSNE